MLIPNHPDDERLSALASRDADATADATLSAHVSTCDRCTELVDELGALRVALADLPDLKPSRPLQLVPPVEADHPVDRLGGWARRFFAPVLVSGAALVLVGVVGTAGPAFSGQSSAGASSDLNEQAAAASAAAAGVDTSSASEPAASDAPALVDASYGAAAPGTAEGAEDGERESLRALASYGVQKAGSPDPLAAAGDAGSGEAAGADESAAVVESSRSPWPMVLFAGVALIIGALLMRWILAPRSA
ncbi:MAG TPA: hypothetical protein VEW95_11035 [Candidatus Limnocylindrales bacterium]|nr:hypothetical protein [Candidatus Limnocylindrales bacterium]